MNMPPRLGRNTINVLQAWKELTDKNITIICRNPSLRNFTENEKVDVFSELMISILSTMASFEKSLIKERQIEGIRIRQAKGLYYGRSVNTKATPEKFLNKPKIKKILAKIEDGYTHQEISKNLNCSYGTIAKAVFL